MRSATAKTKKQTRRSSYVSNPEVKKPLSVVPQWWTRPVEGWPDTLTIESLVSGEVTVIDLNAASVELTPLATPTSWAKDVYE